MKKQQKPKQLKDSHKRILSMPSCSKLLFPKPKTFTPAIFRSQTPCSLNIPKILDKQKEKKEIEHICLYSEISLGLPRFTKVKLPENNTKSEYLFKILNRNAEILTKSKKIIIPVNNPPKFLLERKNNLGYSRLNNYVKPKKITFNNSFNLPAQNSFEDKPKLMNSTQNEIFSTVPQSIVNKQELVQDNIVKKLVIRPRYSRFIFEPLEWGN